MKLKNLASIATLLLATLTAAQAQTNILVGWTFDNLSTGANSAPAASTNSGTASLVGLTTGTVVGKPGSSTGTLVGTNAWDISGGWSTNSAIGSQGAQFAVSTYGVYQVQVSFDVYAATNAEGLLQVQYAPDGQTWFNANITSAGSSGILATNTNPTNGIVAGTYLVLTNSGGTWNNGVTVNLSGISWADNNPNFAIRIVNAATGTNVVSATGGKYGGTATVGDWTFDNLVISGVPFDTAVDWTFDGVGTPAPYLNPAAAISNVNSSFAFAFGFNLTNTLFGTVASGKNISSNAPDVTPNGAPYSSTGTAGQNVWRIRGQPGNGWLSTQPIGSQGAEFDVDTTGYTNIMLSFDLYMTSQGEAKMCVEYTTNNIGGVWGSTNVANTLAYSQNPTFIMYNLPSGSSPALTLSGSTNYSANTVTGTLFFNNLGSSFFNNCIVDLTGLPNVANNPHFAFRIVNAATGADCYNAIYQAYNNNSGNCRLDNVAVNGKFNGSYAPTVTPAPSASVDKPFTNTFAYNPGWSTNIYAIYINGIKLTNSYTITPSNIVFTPTAGPGQATNPAPLTVAGVDNFVIYATNFTSAKVSQLVGAGAFSALYYIQPAGPSASSGTLTVQPNFTCVDQFYNPTTNTYPTMQVVAMVSNSPATWTLGGSVTQSIYNGSCTFTDLNATLIGTTAISNAAITFQITGFISGFASTNSTSFIIGKPPVAYTPGNLAVLQADTAGGNSTLSVIELKPSLAGQTSPVNIVPVSATGTNALRISSAASGGHLTLNDNGTKLVFAAYTDGSSATADETFNLNRGVGTLDYTNGFNLPCKYVSNSLGGSQARAACSPDSMNYLIDDKGGLYIADNGNFYYNLYNQNNISTKSFGGVCWVATAKVASPATASVYIFSDKKNANGVGLNYTANPNDPDPDSQNPDGVFNVGHDTPPTDSYMQDFFIVSTNGNDYSILYVLDQSVTTGVGAITKFAMRANADGSGGPGTISGDYYWVQQGSTFTVTDNGNQLFVTTNGSGGAYLFYVNGNNKIIRLTDQVVSGNLNIISTNTIYTSTNGGNILGLTFVPQQTAGATELIPPPVLTASTSAYPGSSSFTVTMPDDGTWRSNITSITVNGTLLPTAAYATNTAGALVFYPPLSGGVLLTTPGLETIVIAATGYSTNSIVQTVIGPATHLGVGVEPSLSNTAGTLFTSPPIIYVLDANNAVDVTNNGVVVTAITNTVAPAITNSGYVSGPLTGAVTATSVNGVVTFSALVVPTNSQTMTLSYTNATLGSVVDTNAISVVAGAPVQLAMGTEPSSTATAGAAFSTQPQVLIQDLYGNTVTTATSNVVAQVGTGSGTLSGTLTVAASKGVAKFTKVNAPQVAQTGLKLTFTSTTLTSVNDTTSITVNAGAINKLVVTTQPSTTVGAGAAFSTEPAVSIEDQYGNVVTTATTNIIATAVGSGTVSGNTNAAVAGVATFSGLHAPTVPQTTLKLAFAMAFTNSTSLNVTNSSNITVTNGSASKLAFGNQPTTTVAGAAISPSVTVIVQDAYGNTVTGDTSSVTISSTNTGFAVSSTLSVNAIGGTATFSNVKPTTAGALKTLAAADGSLTATNSNTFTVSASTPSLLAISTQPAAPAVNGGVLAIQPIVVIEDQYSNVVSTATSNVVAQVGVGTWTLGGGVTNAAVLGTNTFAGLIATSPSAVTGATISFTSGLLTGTTSTAFNIPAPIASSLGGVKLSSGQFVFTFTNTPGLNISVLSTNDLTVPRPWPVVGTAVEGPSGTYNYTNGTPTNGQQYYYTQP